MAWPAIPAVTDTTIWETFIEDIVLILKLSAVVLFERTAESFKISTMSSINVFGRGARWTGTYWSKKSDP
jgi:hypothetical protein